MGILSTMYQALGLAKFQSVWKGLDSHGQYTLMCTDRDEWITNLDDVSSHGWYIAGDISDVLNGIDVGDWCLPVLELTNGKREYWAECLKNADLYVVIDHVLGQVTESGSSAGEGENREWYISGIEKYRSQEEMMHSLLGVVDSSIYFYSVDRDGKVKCAVCGEVRFT